MDDGIAGLATQIKDMHYTLLLKYQHKEGFLYPFYLPILIFSKNLQIFYTFDLCLVRLTKEAALATVIDRQLNSVLFIEICDREIVK